MNPPCCEIKTAFILIPSKLLKCMSEVHKLNIPFAFQQPNVYTNIGKGLCGRRRNGYLQRQSMNAFQVYLYL